MGARPVRLVLLPRASQQSPCLSLRNVSILSPHRADDRRCAIPSSFKASKPQAISNYSEFSGLTVCLGLRVCVHPVSYQYGAWAGTTIRHYEAFYFAENLLLLAILGLLIFRSRGHWRSIYWQLFGAATLYALGS